MPQPLVDVCKARSFSLECSRFLMEDLVSLVFFCLIVIFCFVVNEIHFEKKNDLK